jgi:hypothetical protein
MGAVGPRTVDERKCARFAYGIGRPARGGRVGLNEHAGAAGPLAQVGRRARHLLGLPPQWSFRRFRALPPAAWAASDKAFGAAEVRDLTARIAGVYRSEGWPARAVAVRAPRYTHRGFLGSSVTLTGDRGER